MKRRLGWIVGLGVAAAALALGLRPLVAQTIAPVVVRLLNALLSMLAALPPLAVWLLFILVTAFVLLFAMTQLAAWAFSRRGSGQSRPRREVLPGPVERLTRWIEQERQGSIFQQRLARHLTHLTLEALGYPDVTAWREIQGRLDEQAATIPPEVMAFLRLGIERLELDSAESPPFLQRLLALFRRPAAARLDPRLEQIIEFLEQQVES